MIRASEADQRNACKKGKVDLLSLTGMKFKDHWWISMCSFWSWSQNPTGWEYGFKIFRCKGLMWRRKRRFNVPYWHEIQGLLVDLNVLILSLISTKNRERIWIQDFQMQGIIMKEAEHFMANKLLIFSTPILLIYTAGRNGWTSVAPWQIGHIGGTVIALSSPGLLCVEAVTRAGMSQSIWQRWTRYVSIPPLGPGRQAGPNGAPRRGFHFCCTCIDPILTTLVMPCRGWHHEGGNRNLDKLVLF